MGTGRSSIPGRSPSSGGRTDVPLPSIRLKLIRMGLQDYEWLKRVSDAGDPEFARAVARDLIPEPWLVPDDGEAFERARLRLIRRYLQLTGADVPASVEAGLSGHLVTTSPDPDEFLRLAQ